MRRTLSLVLALATLAAAEDWTPPENKNAALAYWRAFSMMKDLPSDEETSEKIRKVLSGEAAWDDSLQGVVDENADAVKGLHRGSRLPECTFGVDYEDGAAMLLPHLAKARALGKLNVLQARRCVAQGRHAEAVDALLCGARFADHLWRDGTLINGLVAKAVLSMHLRALIQVVGEGKLDAATLGRVDAAMRALPPYAFDWGAVILSEKACFAIEWERILGAADPKAVMEEGGMFQQEYGSIQDLAAGKASKEVAERFRKEWGMEPTDLADAEKVRECVKRSREDYHGVIGDMGAAMRGSYLEAAPKIAEIEGRADAQRALARMLIPALGKTNEQRAMAEVERAGLIVLVTLAPNYKPSAEAMMGPLALPGDPYTGKAFELVETEAGWEVRTGAKDDDGKPKVFRMAR